MAAHASAQAVRLGEAGMKWGGDSTGELGVGLLHMGGDSSARGNGSVLGSVYEGEMVVVCGSSACAGGRRTMGQEACGASTAR